ncbi:unnamed protein product [Amoebophrya sp. A120]|nr:unnamed protein product [Amoebophrya sp. A120]|eukprot:GSA120T00003742001.1
MQITRIHHDLHQHPLFCSEKIIKKGKRERRRPARPTASIAARDPFFLLSKPSVATGRRRLLFAHLSEPVPGQHEHHLHIQAAHTASSIVFSSVFRSFQASLTMNFRLWCHPLPHNVKIRVQYDIVTPVI